MKPTIKFATFLALVSIAGFLTIMVNSFTNVDIGLWVDGFMFIILGAGLALIGGIFSFKQYMKDGLTDEEVTHILTAVFGVMSIIAGIITLPIGFLATVDLPAFDGIKGTLAFFAIIFIALEAWLIKR